MLIDPCLNELETNLALKRTLHLRDFPRLSPNAGLDPTEHHPGSSGRVDGPRWRFFR